LIRRNHIARRKPHRKQNAVDGRTQRVSFRLRAQSAGDTERGGSGTARTRTCGTIEVWVSRNPGFGILRDRVASQFAQAIPPRSAMRRFSADLMSGSPHRCSLLLCLRQHRACTAVIEVCQQGAATHLLPRSGQQTTDATSLADLNAFHEAGCDGDRAITAEQWLQGADLDGHKFDLRWGCSPRERLRDQHGQPERAEEGQRYNGA
jgi:hypothetical protein